MGCRLILRWLGASSRYVSGMGSGSVWSHGQLLAELAKRAVSQTHVEHPDQFRNVAPAASRRAAVAPLGHQRPAPQVMTRTLAEYDQLCGVEVLSCNLN